ncbi:MAG: hypothetical protein I3273_02365 [Candidatus Moeniiplasma glomeromycotorum]|nr:hypothetical protein [Candidatus Moeniiplasma glomeromycotorum]MCE8167039.1 hypothetical protein [Candidatus Moeniiplasma glomeromycotorum]MCE8168949.1 hypothetical protein [Candidatus Moeniiplasma glomeromycotorum]
MNGWLLLIIIPASLIIGVLIGIGLTFWYLLRSLKKATGIKSWKEFKEQIKKAQKLQNQMKKGHFQMDEDLRKKMEEIAKRFSQDN